MLESDFWQDKSKSKKILKEKKLFEDLINSHENSIIKLKDCQDNKNNCDKNFVSCQSSRLEL